VPRALDDLWPLGDAPIRHRVNVVLSSCAIAVVVLALGLAAGHARSWYVTGYPDRAAAAVAQVSSRDPSTRVFANEAFADWLLWKIPSLSGRVAFDARFELMTREQLVDIVRFRQQRTANRLGIAKGYRVFVLDPAAEKPAVRAIRREPGARTLFRDSHVVVLLRGAG
jgi:hypothetical protein